MSVDLYAEVRGLTALLREREYIAWAERLDDAVASGATGTEILMAVRWTVGQMLTEVPADIAERAQQVVDRIGRTLK